MKDTAMLRMFVFVASSTLFFWLLDQNILWLFSMPVLVIICTICVSYRDAYRDRPKEREDHFRGL